MKVKNKPIFFTSDTHYFHKQVLDFCNRPFSNLEQMHYKLIQLYNSTVPKNGICYFLGDVSFGSTSDTKLIIDQLNGTKILILGNHDKKYHAMYNCGFDVVLNTGSMIIHNQLVTMCHYPLKGIFREDSSKFKGGPTTENWHGENRTPDFYPDMGQFHLHGHIHSPNNGASIKISGKQFDVGVDANKYRPVSISEIESWIMTSLNKVNPKIEVSNE